MKRDQKQGQDGKKGFPGLLLLLIIGLVILLAFQNLSENKLANVAFSHQIEHLVNLDLLDDGHSRKTSVNDNLVSFHGKFRQQLSDSAKDRYRFIHLLHQHHELKALKMKTSKELDKLYRDVHGSVEYFLHISGMAVPQGGLVVVPSQFDTPESANSVVIREVAVGPSNLVSLPEVKKQLEILAHERNTSEALAAGQMLKKLVEEYRSFRLGIGNEELKRALSSAEQRLNVAIDNPQLSYSERLAVYKEVFASVAQVSHKLAEKQGDIRFRELRSVRAYLEQLEKLAVVTADVRKNDVQLAKSRGQVQNVIWFFNNQEISTNELMKKPPEEYQRWFLHANTEWKAFEANKNLSFKAPDQPRTLALEKTFKSEEPPTNYFGYLFTFMPILLVGLLLYFIFSRQVKGGGSSAMNFGKSPAKLLNKSAQRVTFDDVAGINEAKEELEEIVEFLRDPSRFRKLGARIPKGVLLVGSPGTGKTLVAKAVAGEAGVPFFSISGSDFVEMFVGVGASRVRDLFDQARKNAPCIIFIDEIDAVGRHRGSGLGGGHDEREQTLNQLLVEIDGMDSSEGVIIIAATNRPDVLDKALLRPGRFDRSVVVELPDFKGRLEILKVHAKKVKIGENVSLKEIAGSTAGLAGADLENIINEAALFAARKWRSAVTQDDLRYALEKVQFGKERKSLVMNEEDMWITSWHEAGHAIIALDLDTDDGVTKVTRIPRGQSLGATHFQEKPNRVHYRRSELVNRLATLMGGRVAEELHNQDPTSGAKADIQMATQTARAMVREWGMSDKLGMINYSQEGGQSLISGIHEKEYSEATAEAIDQEVKQLIDDAYAKAHQILEGNFDKMKLMAEMLMKFETLDREDCDAIMKGTFSEEQKQNKINEFVSSKHRDPPPVPPKLKKQCPDCSDKPKLA